MTRTALLLIALLVPRMTDAQTATIGGGAQSMVRAAGMPLNDGALPPGMLTVRLVRGAFAGDLAGQTVEVEISGGKIERATTGADGRAQFGHLPIGAEVHAVTNVGNERLESETFTMPAESGVRLLLVAESGTAATIDAGSVADGGAAALPIAPPPAPAPPAAPARDPESGVWAIRATLAVTTLFVFALFMVQRRPRRS
jgi:hypothetical protein